MGLFSRKKKETIMFDENKIHGKEFEKLPEKFTDFEQALRLSNSGKSEEAIEILDVLLKENPTDEDVWHNKGCALSELGKYEESILCFDKLIALNPENEDAWFSKGVVSSKVGENEIAHNCYNNVIRINPKSTS